MEELKKSLKTLLISTGIEKTILQNKALIIWDNVVGDSISKNAFPKEIKHGTLIINTTTSVWRNELIMKKNDILKNLNRALGKQVIKDIRFL